MFIMNINLTIVLLFCFFISRDCLSLPYQKPEIQHGLSFEKHKSTNREISLYYISEKLDGMRGYWDGEQLFTRQGNLINSPIWFTQGWPTKPMDGELWIKPDSFQETISCVRKYIAGQCWQKVHFMIFDLPKHGGRFAERVQRMQNISLQTSSPYLKAIKQYKVSNLTELDNRLNQVINNKGEGLMLHLASAYYHIGRTASLLKLKKHQDGEAMVIEHISGRGKYQHMLGAIKVKTSEGIIFKIGSGFTEQERTTPPAIGTLITYKYNGLTKAGKPRFARFWRIRAEKETARR